MTEHVEQLIGPRIRIAREKAGMDVAQFARRVGVQEDSVQAWEADERTPRAHRLLVMAGVLGVSFTWLLEGREDQRMQGDGPSLEVIRLRLQAARNQVLEGLRTIEAAEEALHQYTSQET